jgi:hypothetical protein
MTTKSAQLEPLVKPLQYRHRNISSGKLKREEKDEVYVRVWGSEGGSYNPPTLYLLPCVETQTQSRTLAESFNTIYSLPQQGKAQDKGDQEACHVDGLGLGISRKRGSSHYLRTLYANQGSPSAITANGERRKKVWSGSPPSVTSSSSRAASSSKSWSYQAVGRALLIEVVKAS